MTKRMLIDSSHAEETRVVVLDGNRLEDYDVETATKKQLKGNIYLAKIVRVEPSLQAAFVEYGGNRHGFLAFGEIHPDYYQIPVADRQRLLAMQEEEAEAERLEEDERSRREALPGGEEAEVERAAAEARAETEADEAEARADAAGDAAETGPETHPEGGQETGAGGEGSDGQDEDGERTDGPPPETVGGEQSGDDRAERRTSQRLLRHYKIQEVIRRRQIVLVQVVKEERGSKGAALTTYISLAGRYSVLMPNSPRGGGVSRKITSAADRRRLKEVTAELGIPRGMAMIVRTAGAQRPKPEIKRDGEYLLQLWDDIRDTTMQSMAPALIHEEASLIKRAIRDVYSREIGEILVDGEPGWRAARAFMRMLMPPDAKKVQLWREGQPLFARAGVEGMLDGMLHPNVQLRSGGTLVINQAEALVAIDVNSGRSTRERGIEETALRTNLEAADEVARQLRLRDLAGLIVIDFIDMESRRHNAMVERRLKDALRIDRARIQVGSISAFGLLEMSRQRLRPSLAESSFSPCSHCQGTGLVRSTESASLHVLRAIEAAGAARDTALLTAHVATDVALYVLNQKRAWVGEIERRCAMEIVFAVDPTLLGAAYRLTRTRMRAPDEIPPPLPVAAPPAAEPEDDAFAIAEEDEDVADIVDAPVAARAANGAARPEAAASGPKAPSLPAAPGGAATAPAGEEDRPKKRRRRRRRGGRREDGSPVEAGADGNGDAVGADEDDDEAETLADGEMVPGMAVVVSGEPMMDAAGEAGASIPSREASASGAPASEAPGSEAGFAAGNVAAAPPVATDAPFAADEAGSDAEAKPRRGRRGGRRRRRDEGDAEPSAASEASPATAPYAGPAPAPAPYSGPTPADPFNGAYDIFEALEQGAAEDRTVTNPAASAASLAASEPPAKPARAERRPSTRTRTPRVAAAAPSLADPIEAERASGAGFAEPEAEAARRATLLDPAPAGALPSEPPAALVTPAPDPAPGPDPVPSAAEVFGDVAPAPTAQATTDATQAPARDAVEAPAPAEDTAPVSVDHTAPVPVDHTAPVPVDHTAPVPVDEAVAAPPAQPILVGADSEAEKAPRRSGWWRR